MHGHHDRLLARVEQRLEIVGIGKERRGVPVRSHAEYGRVERPWQVAERLAGEHCRRFCTVGLLEEADEACRRRRTLQ